MYLNFIDKFILRSLFLDKLTLIYFFSHKNDENANSSIRVNNLLEKLGKFELSDFSAAYLFGLLFKTVKFNLFFFLKNKLNFFDSSFRKKKLSNYSKN
jgi:hypothetical protein